MTRCDASTDEIAKMFGVCRRTIDRLRQQGLLSHWKIGKQYRFDPEVAKVEFRRLGHKVAAAGPVDQSLPPDSYVNLHSPCPCHGADSAESSVLGSCETQQTPVAVDSCDTTEPPPK